MLTPFIALTIAGIIISTGVFVGGYFVGEYAQKRLPDRQIPLASTLLPIGSPSSIDSPLPSGQVEGTATQVGVSPLPSSTSVVPTVTPRVVKSPSPILPTHPPTPTPTQVQVSSAKIVFLNLPDEVRSGQSFMLRWRVEGPGSSEGSTTLHAAYHNSSSAAGSSSSTSSTTRQSFGFSSLPREFSTQLTFGVQGGTIEVEITADISGTTVREEKSIKVVD